MTLVEALERWRIHRHPALADAVDRLDAERPARSAPRRAADFQQHWLATAENPNAQDVGWLAETFGSRVPIDREARMFADRDYIGRRYAALLARVEALGRLEADPRVSRALIAFVDTGKYPCGYEPNDVAVLYGPMFELIARIGDVRALEALVQIEDGAAQATNRTVRDGLRAPAGRCRAALERVDIDEPADIEELQREDHTPEYDPTELYQEILEDPANLELREVYADLLQHNADPRGTFIALQLHGDEQSDKRAARLLRKHKDAWLGPLLARVLTHVEFRDGFLAEARVGPNPRADAKEWRQAAHDQRLATVQSLWLGRSNHRNYLEFLTSRSMRSLEAYVIPAKWMFEPVTKGPNAGRTVIVQLDFIPSRQQLLALAERMPKLEELVFKSSKSAAPMHRRAIEPLRQRDVEIEVYGCPPGLVTITSND